MARKKINLEDKDIISLIPTDSLDYTDTFSLLQNETNNSSINKKYSLSTLLEDINEKAAHSIISFTQNPSIGTTISCIGVLLDKKGPILSIAYPHMLIFMESSNKLDAIDTFKLYPYNGIDLTEFTGDVLSDGILHVNADSINTGYILYSGKSMHPFVKAYVEELSNITKYIN